MIDRILDTAVRFRWAVVAVTLIVAVYGAFQLFRLPIDAVPDITNKQVQVNTAAPAFGPLDMERLVTFPYRAGRRRARAFRASITRAQSPETASAR